MKSWSIDKGTTIVNVFESEEELISELRKFKKRVNKVIEEYRNNPFQKGWSITPKNTNLDNLLEKYTFSGSWANMSFGGEGSGSRPKYKEWLKEESEYKGISHKEIIKKRIFEINNQKEYDSFVFNLAASLSNKFGDPKLKGKCMKIVNLIIKHMLYELIETEKDKKRIKQLRLIENFAHVPWDRDTLRRLRDIKPKNLPNINTGTTLSYVKDFETYITLYNFIKRICKKAGVPMIYYEFLTWDEGRKNNNKNQIKNNSSLN